MSLVPNPRVPPAALCILTMYAEGGSLEAAISQQAKDGTPFGSDLVVTWSVQLVAALAHLHEQAARRDRDAHLRAVLRPDVQARVARLAVDREKIELFWGIRA